MCAVTTQHLKFNMEQRSITVLHTAKNMGWMVTVLCPVGGLFYEVFMLYDMSTYSCTT